MAKQYYLIKDGDTLLDCTFLVPEQTALNYVNRKEYKVIKKIIEIPNISFFCNKSLKALIETGSAKNKKIMYYKVTLYGYKQEVIVYKIFDTSKIPITSYKGINEVYQKAVEYAQNYLNHCKRFKLY